MRVPTRSLPEGQWLREAAEGRDSTRGRHPCVRSRTHFAARKLRVAGG